MRVDGARRTRDDPRALALRHPKLTNLLRTLADEEPLDRTGLDHEVDEGAELGRKAAA